MNSVELSILAGKKLPTTKREKIYKELLLPIFKKVAEDGRASVVISWTEPNAHLKGDMHERKETLESIIDNGMIEYCTYIKGFKCKVVRRPRLAIEFTWGIRIEEPKK